MSTYEAAEIFRQHGVNVRRIGMRMHLLGKRQVSSLQLVTLAKRLIENEVIDVSRGERKRA